MTARVCFVLAGLFSASLAHAQTPCISPTPQTTPPTFTCQTGSAHTLLWDHVEPVITGDVFRVYVNNAQIGADIPARTATGISVQFGATLPPASYVVAVSLFRPAAANPEARSAPITLVMVPSPVANPTVPPGNLRIVEVIMRGKDLAGHILWTHTAEMVVPAQ